MFCPGVLACWISFSMQVSTLLWIQISFQPWAKRTYYVETSLVRLSICWKKSVRMRRWRLKRQWISERRATKTYDNRRPPRRVTVIENVYVLAGEPLRSGRPPGGQSALHAGVGGVEASAILSSDSWNTVYTPRTKVLQTVLWSLLTHFFMIAN